MTTFRYTSMRFSHVLWCVLFEQKEEEKTGAPHNYNNMPYWGNHKHTRARIFYLLTRCVSVPTYLYKNLPNACLCLLKLNIVSKLCECGCHQPQISTETSNTHPNMREFPSAGNPAFEFVFTAHHILTFIFIHNIPFNLNPNPRLHLVVSQNLLFPFYLSIRFSYSHSQKAPKKKNRKYYIQTKYSPPTHVWLVASGRYPSAHSHKCWRQTWAQERQSVVYWQNPLYSVHYILYDVYWRMVSDTERQRIEEKR